TNIADARHFGRKRDKLTHRSKLSRTLHARATVRASPTGHQTLAARRSRQGFRSLRRALPADIDVLRTMPRLAASAAPNPQKADRYPFQLSSRQDSHHSQSHKS